MRALGPSSLFSMMIVAMCCAVVVSLATCATTAGATPATRALHARRARTLYETAWKLLDHGDAEEARRQLVRARDNESDPVKLLYIDHMLTICDAVEGKYVEALGAQNKLAESIQVLASDSSLSPAQQQYLSLIEANIKSLVAECARDMPKIEILIKDHEQQIGLTMKIDNAPIVVASTMPMVVAVNTGTRHVQVGAYRKKEFAKSLVMTDGLHKRLEVILEDDPSRPFNPGKINAIAKYDNLIKMCDDHRQFAEDRSAGDQLDVRKIECLKDVSAKLDSLEKKLRRERDALLPDHIRVDEAQVTELFLSESEYANELISRYQRWCEPYKPTVGPGARGCGTCEVTENSENDGCLSIATIFFSLAGVALFWRQRRREATRICGQSFAYTLRQRRE